MKALALLRTEMQTIISEAFFLSVHTARVRCEALGRLLHWGLREWGEQGLVARAGIVPNHPGELSSAQAPSVTPRQKGTCPLSVCPHGWFWDVLQVPPPPRLLLMFLSDSGLQGKSTDPTKRREEMGFRFISRMTDVGSHPRGWGCSAWHRCKPNPGGHPMGWTALPIS